jgi:putative lipoic acid-binding regulatory protein
MTADDPTEPPASAPTSPEEARARALALLEATHVFPVAYEVTVITITSDDIHGAVRAAAGHGLDAPLGDEDHTTVPSKGGKYTSHRLRVRCARPVDVLALYERLRAIEGVKTLL